MSKRKSSKRTGSKIPIQFERSEDRTKRLGNSSEVNSSEVNSSEVNSSEAPARPLDPEAPPSAVDRPRSKAESAALGAVLAILGVALYFPSLSGGPLWDDDTLIFQNLDLRTLDGLVRIWLGRGTLDFFPVSLTSFWIEHQLFGASPLGYRVVSALLHAINAIVLWRLLARLRAPGAWLAALLFVVHPLCVPSVAWISERKNELALLFALLATRSWLGSGDARPTTRQRVSSLLYFLASLLAKPAAVALPLAWLALAAWKRALGRRDVLWATPHLFAALTLGSITLQAQSDAPVDAGPWAERLARAGYSLGFYLSKVAVPTNLSMIYPKWAVDPTHLEAWVPLGSIAAGVGLMIWQRRRCGAAWVAFAWFLALVAPVLGLVSMAYMRHAHVSDHLVYLALPGPLALWAGSLGRGMLSPRLAIRRLSTFVAVLHPAVLLAWTIQREPDFGSAERLFRSSLESAPNSWSAHLGLAMTLSDQNRVAEALDESESAVGLAPSEAAAQALRGSLLLTVGREAEAVASLEEALRLNPRQFKVHNNLASVKLKRKDVAGAIEHLKQSVELEPSYALGHANLARLLVALGRTEEARAHYRRAIELSPELSSLFSGPP
ncbi:MAG: tetratricopeptide repeat protein [Deltaproteobacteria bacterium]|nr:tetratricopeptide repeat protein [Deltaproteobacteria bacterium]